MQGEILGFKVDGTKGTAILNPIISAREYEKHKEYFSSKGIKGEVFEFAGILVEAGQYYLPYEDELRDDMIKNMSELVQMVKKENGEDLK